MEAYTEEYKGYTIRIEYDQDAESPREWDNLGTMVYKHRNYTLGDKEIQDHWTDDQGYAHYIETWEEVEAYLRKTNDIAIMLPLGLYDHSGITMYIGDSHDRWDGGQVGYIYVTKDTLRKEYNVKRITKAILEKAEQVLRGEVKTFDQFIRGNVYGYIVEKDGEHIDSCWGFFDDYSYTYTLEEARSVVDYQVQEDQKKRVEKTKKQIKGNVPLIYRQ